jgi:hypothetical protein
MNYDEELLKSGLVEDGRQTLPRGTRTWSSRNPENLKGMVLHQSLETKGSASSVAEYHSGPNHIRSDGLPGLSYTLFVERDGKVILANSIADKTWSQGYKDPDGVDENAMYMGVCVGGNFSGPGYLGTQVPTIEQLDAVSNLWNLCRGLWHWSGNGLLGHFHFGKPACPGDVLAKYIYSQRSNQFASVVDKQRALQILGYYKAKVDGDWGPVSKAALVAFQIDAGLDPDGVWGSLTSAAVFHRLRRR